MAKPKNLATAGSLSATSGKPTGCLLFLIGIPFAGIGITILFSLVVQPFLKSQQAANWDTVEAEVTVSEVAVSKDSDETTYDLNFAYTYTYEGQDYTSDKYGFASVGRSARAPFQEIVDRHPVGSTVTAHINPQAPDEAVVNPSLRGGSLVSGLLFGPVFACLGLGVMVVGFVLFRRGRRASGTGPARTQVTPSGERYAEGTIPEPRIPDVNGKVHLDPAKSRLGTFFGILVFTLFWNGIVGAVSFGFVGELRSGEMHYGMVLFLLPFIGIGLVMIGMTIYQFMALFNPKVKLWISPGRARPGQTFTVGWNFEGPVGRLEDFRLSLQGKERATYRQGTRTYTDEHLFHDHLIMETTDRMDISSGSTEVTLPVEAIHSFNTVNNKIIWHFKLQGHIRRWPNLTCDYPFVLLPPPPSHE
ncbi:MAG: DUF3592 domain-containing protein [Opitutales bacterium]|nr:DUF3592 domain-containing protein [Opitutales bacterium]MCH8541491.1 DUF3592 domain-containing protein [Opitutales bacterium]